MGMPRRVFAGVVLLICPQIARATILTNTRPGIAQMAGCWEVDSVQISALVSSNYPAFTNNWEYMQPSTGSTSTDGDEHLNMAVSPSGTGATGNNGGTESPLVAEIINAAGSLLPLGNTHAKSRGIFRYYHEHAGEVKYEIHPITERDTWNGSAFVFANDYHNTIRPVMDGTNKALSTYTDIVQGNNQTVTVAVSNDNVHVMITFPTAAGADTVNYLQYDGQVVQTLTSDSISPFITFHATSCPKGSISGARVMRCRIITNTVAATVAASLGSNQTVTVNVLNRVDMLGISNVVASLGAGQSTSIVQPLEWITCGLTNVGPNVLPSAIFSGSPTNGIEPLLVTFADTSTGSMITNRFWDFGDSSTTNVTTNSVSHTYAAGTYGVTLIVSGSGGSGTNSKPNYITVLTAFQGWQTRYFGSPTNAAAAAGADPDGDGCNNLCEFLSGTDPTNSASSLRITSVLATGSDVAVTWATALGHTNVVQANSGLPDGSYTTNFSDVSPLIIMDPGTGDFTTNYTDPGSATNFPTRYYRIRLQP
jgi:PKD repeat protein